jgi:phage recombination protein Bet
MAKAKAKPADNVEQLPAQVPAELASRDMNLEQWRILREVIFPEAESKESIVLAIDYCIARKLDIFKRPVHIVPVWNRKQAKLVDTIWPGINELRTTAARTGSYAGQDEAVLGPMTSKTFDEVGEIHFHEWASVTVYRMVQGERVGFTGTVYWLETYATKGKSDVPNAMWARRTTGQLVKCAEAEALRKAFPEEIGAELTMEEMQGQAIGEEEAPPRPSMDDPEYQGETIEGEAQEVEPEPEKGPALYTLHDFNGEELGLYQGKDFATNLVNLLDQGGPHVEQIWENNQDAARALWEDGFKDECGAIAEALEASKNAPDTEDQGEQPPFDA